MFENYIDVREWLENFIPYTYSKENLGLERIRYLLKLLGDPQKKFKSILVAGTSGKGSVAFYISRLLQSSVISSQFSGSGQKIGLHLSPHLIYIGERMRVQGIEIRVKRLVNLINEIRPIVEEIKKESPDLTPSYFEILVAASFLYFAQEKVDWAVVEVGLGGRLDATNVLEPELSVITNVGLDHTDILGNSIEKIAFEKAGIIKNGVPVVTGADGKALKIIEKVAKEKNASLINLNTLSSKKQPKSDVYRYISRPYYVLRDSQNGFASSNKNLALLAVLTLMSLRAKRSNLKKGKIATPRKAWLAMTIDPDVFKKAFSVGLAGRFEEIDERVILDGAHNVDKIRFLIDFVKNSKSETLNSKQIQNNVSQGHKVTKFKIQNKSNIIGQMSIILVVAFKKGKDWKKMLDLLIKNLPVKRIIATKFYVPTDTGFFAAVEPEEIADFVKSKSKVKVESFDNSQGAVFEALNANLLNANQLILVTGSLYLVGEARTLWKLPQYSI